MLSGVAGIGLGYSTPPCVGDMGPPETQRATLRGGLVIRSGLRNERPTQTCVRSTSKTPTWSGEKLPDDLQRHFEQGRVGMFGPLCMEAASTRMEAASCNSLLLNRDGRISARPPEPHANSYSGELRQRVATRRCSGHRCCDSDPEGQPGIVADSQRNSQRD